MRPSADVAWTNEEAQVLHRQRLVETECCNGALAILLIGLRIDEDVDRVADGIDADEHQQRHDKQDDDALEASPDDENQHVRK